MLLQRTLKARSHARASAHRRVTVVMRPRSSGHMRPDQTDYFCPMLDRIESGERRQIIELRLVDRVAVVIGQMQKNIGRLVLQFLFDCRQGVRVRPARVEEQNRAAAAECDRVPAKKFHQDVVRLHRRRPFEKRRDDFLERQSICAGQNETGRALLQE